MHLCRDELMALVAAFPAAVFLVRWVQAWWSSRG